MGIESADILYVTSLARQSSKLFFEKYSIWLKVVRAKDHMHLFVFNKRNWSWMSRKIREAAGFVRQNLI